MIDAGCDCEGCDFEGFEDCDYGDYVDYSFR
jgi:hypothetical protein